MKSILQNNAECFVCRKFYNVATLHPLEKHHFIHGRGMRKLADEDGLFAWVCCKHHRDIHDKGLFDKDLQIVAQRAYIEKYSREEWFKRYGKYYE